MVVTIKMIKFLAILTVICAMVSSCGFLSPFGFGTFYETNENNYGEWASFLDIPSFLPDSVNEYKVNSYSYTLYNYLDICYEIFLDITVDENKFDSLLEIAQSYSNDYEERPADYIDGYTEIVFVDKYSEYKNGEQVDWADIEKIIYNREVGNIIYVAFHAHDTGVYDIKDVAYFNRFSIDSDNYQTKE